jgi:hypothetical protein
MAPLFEVSHFLAVAAERFVSFSDSSRQVQLTVEAHPWHTRWCLWSESYSLRFSTRLRGRWKEVAALAKNALR